MDNKTHIYNPQEENQKLLDEIRALRNQIERLACKYDKLLEHPFGVPPYGFWEPPQKVYSTELKGNWFDNQSFETDLFVKTCNTEPSEEAKQFYESLNKETK